MANKTERNNTILTILSKSAIVIINFAITVCITQFWGAEGKGYQALFTTNLALIVIATNIFSNSSISYFVQKVGVSKLYAQACLWIFISSSVGVLICYFVENSNYLIFLLIAAILTGYLTFHNALYIGTQKIKYFNLITILQPLFLLLFLFLFYYTKKSTYFDYFYAHIISLIIAIIIATIFTRKTVGKIKLQIDFTVTKQSFKYGFQNELSNFFQFLATRLSFYFIVLYMGKPSLGIFSVGIALSESIWTISKSISMVQYSKILKEGNTADTRKAVIRSSVFSVTFSLFCLMILLLLPQIVFTHVFGNEFSDIKQIILLMSPGILCAAFSNVYGHYFAAIGQMKILVLKSVIGALITLLLSVILIPLWQMSGACITNSIVHVLCSAIIIFYFIIFKKKEIL